MEGIAKYVLTMAGEGKEEYVMPENRCIRVDDVEKVLMSVGVPSAESDVGSRDFLNGASICVDSISSTLLNDTIQLITIYFQEFVPIQTLSVTLSPPLPPGRLRRWLHDRDLLRARLHRTDSLTL